MPLRHLAPRRGFLATIIVCGLVAPLAAQPKKSPAPVPASSAKADKGGPTGDKTGGGPAPKVKNFDFNALDLNGRMRTPQLLYFLERANEELERASLEKRSFIPHIVRSVEEEQL
jgi:hypothetical protein